MTRTVIGGANSTISHENFAPNRGLTKYRGAGEIILRGPVAVPVFDVVGIESACQPSIAEAAGAALAASSEALRPYALNYEREGKP
jgi:hypothetical protein